MPTTPVTPALLAPARPAPTARRTLVMALAALVLALCAPLLTAPRADADATATYYLVAKVNAERKARGLAPLAVRYDLYRHAYYHSLSMSSRRALYHTADFRVLCCWRVVAENVAYAGSATQAHAMLMASPGHRANILRSSVREVGIGTYRDRYGRLWVTEVFRG